MSEWQTEFEARAKALVDQAVSEPWSVAADDAGGGDVQQDVLSFGRQYSYFTALGLTHPCLAPEGAEPFPLDASVVVGPDWAQRYSFPRGVASEVHRLVGRMGAELAERSNVGYAELDPDVARGSFGRRLARFLGSRFRVNSQEITATTSGLDFTVHTQSSGLRVQFSPAYWFSPRVFGAPTTPVSRPMPPGRFIFGAEGPYLPLQFDSAEYDLPPMTSATLYA